MTARPIDAVSSFAAVIEKVPKWSDQISQLVQYTTQKHAEFRTEYQRLMDFKQPQLKSQPTSRRTRSHSSRSVPRDADGDLPMRSPQSPSTAPSPTGNPADVLPLESNNRYIYAHANKKRRTGTSIRSGASGPVKFRSRQTVVVHYDSHVQEQLEVLVKELSGCRNTLRKGKMTYTVSKGLQLPTLRRTHDVSTASSLTSIKTTALSQGSPGLSTTKDVLTLPDATSVGETAFRSADKDLENCQNLCETAAHQFLRDGDCETELNAVRQTFGVVLEQARIAYEMFKSEDEADKTTERASSISDSVHTTSGSTLVEKLSREQLTLKRRSGLVAEEDVHVLSKERPPLSSTVSAPPLLTEIEADDDSDASSIEIDITQFRGNRGGGVRA